MVIPSNVMKSIEKKPTDNNFIYGAEMLYKRLSDVIAGKVEYCFYDMATAANCLEMYYKGMLEASGCNVSPTVMYESHNLKELYNLVCIECIPLTPNADIQTQRDIGRFLKELSAEYINARYNASCPLESEFKGVMEFITSHREKIMSTLDPDRSWDSNKPKQEYVPDWMEK